MAKHYLVFVHGIGERETDKPSRQGHIDAGYSVIRNYTTLWNNLACAFQQANEQPFNEVFAPVYTSWHTEQIHKAEKAIHNAAFPDLVKRQPSLMRPIRNFATFFLGDVIAYVSTDVNLIRRTVWTQMWDQLKPHLQEEGATYSIIAHSLGTAITFDYLYHLFQQDELFTSEMNPGMEVSAADLALLRERFRHFFTLGAPIGLFMLRQGKLWADGNPFATIHNPIRGNGRTWLNFYDRKDAIAYPLKSIFNLNPDENKDCSLADIQVRAGWTPFSAHTNYWQHKGVARHIASTLQGNTVPVVSPSGSPRAAIA